MKDDLVAFGYETITVTSGNTTVSLSFGEYNNPAGQPVKRALIYVGGGPNISFTLDGTTASSATGHQITSFMSLDLYGYDQISRFRTTSAASGTTGIITVTYFR